MLGAVLEIVKHTPRAPLAYLIVEAPAAWPYIELASTISICHTEIMSEPAKKITANLPAKLLERAQRATGKGITETLIAGLEALEKSQQRSALRGLRGKVRFELDLDETRR